MAIQLHQTTIPGSNDLPVGVDIRLLESLNSPAPAIIICHGFKGFKDWGFFPYLAEYLAEQGFIAVTFNFSHNGHLPHSSDCTELDNFKANLPSRELFDLGCVFSYLKSEQFPFSSILDQKKISVAGHSRGGGVAICFAGKEPQVHSLITLASVASYHIFAKDVEERWRKDGELIIENARTNQQLPLGLTLLDEILKNKDIITDHASRIACPTLIIHSEADPTVSVSSAKLLNTTITNSQTCIIPGSGHTFEISHPYKGSSPGFELVKKQFGLFLQI